MKQSRKKVQPFKRMGQVIEWKDNKVSIKLNKKGRYFVKRIGLNKPFTLGFLVE